MKPVSLQGLSEILRRELDRHVIPFWRRHGMDEAHGGLFTCLDEDGRVLSTEKYLWSQARALWVFSTLAQRHGAASDRQIADSLARFCADHGRNSRGEWVFRVSREGAILQDADSIYTDGFALLGFSAYHTLAPSNRWVELLQATAASVQARLATPGAYDIFPYRMPPGAKAHGVAMLFSLAFWEAGVALHDDTLRQQSLALADDILRHFVSPRDRAVLEFLDLDDRPLSGPLGRCCVPGHALESMWALIRIFRAAHRPADVARCVEIMRWHIELGWDAEFGGLLLAVDLDGNPSCWRFADFKPWWPAVEAMHALLLAYRESGAAWCLEWYERVHNYAFTHYPVRPDGEWRNRLNRRGEPVEDVIGLPVKDPFHLPRSLIYCGDILQELAADPAELNLVVT